MAKSTRTLPAGIASLVAGLQRALAALPTESEKNDVREACDTLTEFLTELKDTFTAVPSVENMDTVRQTLEKIEEVLGKAQASPVLRAVLSLPRRRGTPGARGAREDDTARGKAALADLERLSMDEVRLKLADEGSYSLRDLRAIASAMGIRSTSMRGLDRAGLTHRIATRIANYRGYEALSPSPGSTNASASQEEPAPD